MQIDRGHRNRRDSDTVSVERVVEASPGEILPYRTTSTVIEYAPERRIAWQTFGLGGLVGGRIWRCELTPTDGGTLVRETWDVSADKQKRMITGGSIPEQTARGMRATLDRIAALLET